MNWSKEKPQIYYLDDSVVSTINSSLQPTIDVSNSPRLLANLNKCFQGVIPVGKGFFTTEQQAQRWIQADSKNKDVLKLSSSAGDLTDQPQGFPTRWIIDFNDLDIEEASNYLLPFGQVRNLVKPERGENRDSRAREYWWRFLRPRPEMRKVLQDLSFCLSMPSHSKWFIFLPTPIDWLPNNSINVVASDDFYILGILTSNVHRTWVKAQSSTLKGDTRYTHNTCFETFPFPQTPASTIRTTIRTTAQELHAYRSTQMEKKQWGITKLYNEYFHEPTSQLFKLHAQLDRLVMQAYGFNDTDDILEKLLTLNLELAAKEQRGEPVVGCWAPADPQVQ